VHFKKGGCMNTDLERQRLTSRAAPAAMIAMLLSMLAACGGNSMTSSASNNGGGSQLAPGTELLYVGDSVGQIHGFSIDPNSGALTGIGVFAVTNLAAAADVSLAADPSGTALYATSAGLGGPNVVAETVNSASGALTAVAANATLPVPAGPIAVDPNGKNVYVITDQGVFAFAVDPTTHGLAALSSQPTGVPGIPHDITVAPSGAFAYVTFEGSSGGEIAGMSRDPNTGALGLLPGTATSTGGDSPQGVRVTPNGNFVILVNQGTSTVFCRSVCVSVFSLDPNTGALATVPGSPFASGDAPGAIAIDPSGKFVFVGNTGGNSLSAYTIDSAGSLTPVTGSPLSLGVNAQPSSIAVDPSGKFVYVSIVPREVAGFALDASTAALTPMTGSPFAVGEVTRGVVVVKP
jgi:6-phosphogluconolactonase